MGWPVQYITVQYNANSTIHYNTIQYITVQYITVQYNTLQYNTLQYKHCHEDEQKWKGCPTDLFPHVIQEENLANGLSVCDCDYDFIELFFQVL